MLHQAAGAAAVAAAGKLAEMDAMLLRAIAKRAVVMRFVRCEYSEHRLQACGQIVTVIGCNLCGAGGGNSDWVKNTFMD